MRCSRFLALLLAMALVLAACSAPADPSPGSGRPPSSRATDPELELVCVITGSGSQNSCVPRPCFTDYGIWRDGPQRR